GRVTLNGGVRLDTIKTSFPSETYGPQQFTPTRNFTLPDTPNVDWKDVSWRTGAAIDVLGNGKTALKVSLNKYLIGVDSPAFSYGTQAPYNRIVHTTTRSWTDANGNWFPDCDLTNTGAQDLRATGGDFCGALADPNLGKQVLSTNYDPAAVNGWG